MANADLNQIAALVTGPVAALVIMIMNQRWLTARIETQDAYHRERDKEWVGLMRQNVESQLKCAEANNKIASALSHIERRMEGVERSNPNIRLRDYDRENR